MANRLWPIHPHPLQDELLSSWMIRIAHGNGFKVHNFYAAFLGRERQIWNRDIDHHAPPWLLKTLAERTGVSHLRAVQTTLRDLESWAFEVFVENGITKWVLPLGILHRKRRSFGQQFCPLCFRDDEQPYLRRSWRLGLTFICVRHGVFMQDRCSVCEHPLAPHRSDFGARQGVPEKTTMARCYNCKSRVEGQAIFASAQLSEIQKNINKALDLGFVELGNCIIYTPQFLDGLRRLMRLAPTGLVDSKKRIAFELESIRQRSQLMQYSMHLLSNWPTQFLMRCKEVPRAYTTLTVGRGELPYWLYSQLRRNVYMGKSDISKQEAIAMVNIVDRQVLSGSAIRRVREMWGKDIGHLVPQNDPVSADVAAVLIGSLDHEISLANEQERILLLRDKVMFLCARCLKLTPSQLMRLGVVDVSTISDEVFSSWGHTETTEQAYAMLSWYKSKLRPHLASKSETALFLTYRGTPLSANGASARFVRAVNGANLRKRVPSWNRWIASVKLQSD
jgi:hypothetical protein